MRRIGIVLSPGGAILWIAIVALIAGTRLRAVPLSVGGLLLRLLESRLAMIAIVRRRLLLRRPRICGALLLRTTGRLRLRIDPRRLSATRLRCGADWRPP